MTERNRFFKHVFGGGFASDFGSDAETILAGNNTVVIPYLVDAENLVYDLDGGPIKSPGTTKLNSSAVESGAYVYGLVDAWFSGTTGAPVQKRVIHAGTKILKDDADGTFDDLFTGLESGKIPSYTMLEDLLIMTSNSTTDVPKSWDNSTAQSLAGSPPNFAICTTHKNRVWASGNAALPSRLYYSASLNGADWTGRGSGHIDIDPSDGDIVTGIRSYKDQLIVFKGPNIGSIHVISGNAPFDFAKNPLVTGVGAVGHNSIFNFRDDLGFMWADGSIRSLSATAAQGDFAQGALSAPISKWIRTHLNITKANQFWAANNDEYGHILFSVAINGSATNNYTLMMDYRFSPVRWAIWPAYLSGCVASVVDGDTNNRRIIMAGGVDGFVRKYNQATGAIDGTGAINYKWTTPFLNYGNPIMLKNIEQASLSLVAENNNTLTLGWTRDSNAKQTVNFTQSGNAVLDSFTLGTDALAGGAIIDLWTEMTDGGEFHSIQYQLSESATTKTNIHGFGVSITGGGWSTA